MSFVRVAPPEAPLPSPREMTLKQVAMEGPKKPHRVTPAELNQSAADTNASAPSAPRVPKPQPILPVPPEQTEPVASNTAPPAPPPAPQVVASSASIAPEPGPPRAPRSPTLPSRTQPTDFTPFARADPNAAAKDRPLPSEREATVARVARDGPKQPNHVPPAQLGADATQTADVENTVFDRPKPPRQPPPQGQPRAASSAPASTPPLPTAAQPATTTASPAASRDAKLPSMREMTLRNAEAARAAGEGTSRGHRVRPEDLPSELAVKMDVENTMLEKQAPEQTPAPPPATSLAETAPEPAARVEAVAEPPSAPTPAAPEAVGDTSQSAGAAVADQPLAPLQPIVEDAVPATAAATGSTAPPAPTALRTEPPPAQETNLHSAERLGINGGGREGDGISRQSGLRPQTKPPAFVKAAAEAPVRPERLSQPLPPRAEPEPPAAQPGQLPSMREMTIQNTERFGVNRGAHVPPVQLPLSQRLTADVYHTDALHAPRPPAAPATPPHAGLVASALAYLSSLSLPTWRRAATPAAAAVHSLSAVATTSASSHLTPRLPSQREMTLRNMERWGPKGPNHVQPEQLTLHERLTADVRNDLWSGPPPRRAAIVAEEAHQQQGGEVGVAVSVGGLASATSGAALSDGREASIGVSGDERLPSQREITLRNTARWGPTKANHVPPSPHGTSATTTSFAARATGEGVGTEAAAAPAAPAAARSGGVLVPATSAAPATTVSTSTLGVGSAANAAAAAGRGTGVRAAAAGTTALLGKPLSEWDRADVKRVGRALVENRVTLSLAAVGAAALTVFSIYKGAELINRYHLQRCLAEVEREQPSTVHLYILRRSPLAPSVSVPCSWVETYLRVARIPYEAHVISDPAVSPNGQMPFIIHRTTKLAGANEIIEYLRDAHCGVDMDAELTGEQRATGVAMLSTLSYSLTRGYTRSVFLDKPDVIKPYYSEMNATPDWITRFALQRMAARIEKQNRTTGYAFYTSEQADAGLLQETRAVEALLSSHSFLFSDTQPTSFDCALYAWLLPVIAMENASSVSAAFRHMARSRVMVRFVKEMTVSAFPDFEEIVRDEFYIPDVPRGGAIKDKSERNTPTKVLTYDGAHSV